MSIVFYAIDNESNIIRICEAYWYEEIKGYSGFIVTKRRVNTKLSNIEKERLALLKLSPKNSSIKNVGTVGHSKYYVVKEHQK